MSQFYGFGVCPLVLFAGANFELALWLTFSSFVIGGDGKICSCRAYMDDTSRIIKL